MPNIHEDEDIASILSSIQRGQPADIPVSQPVQPRPAAKPEPVTPVHDLSRSSMFKRQPDTLQAISAAPQLPAQERETEAVPPTPDVAAPYPTPVATPAATKKKRSFYLKRKAKAKKTPAAPQQAAAASPQPYIPYLPDNETKASVRPAKAAKRKRRPKKWLLYAPAVIFFLIGTGILAAKPVKSMLEPKSPFTEQTKVQFGFPLYYPVRPPSGYKIELDSIKAAEGEPVAVMGLSNGSGQSFTITQQDQPGGLTTDDLKEVTPETRPVTSPYGQAVTGSTKDRDITNILTGETWIIITAPKGLLDAFQLERVVMSLKKG